VESSASKGAHLGQLDRQLGEKCCSGTENISAGNETYLSLAFRWPFLSWVPAVLVSSDTSEMVTF